MAVYEKSRDGCSSKKSKLKNKKPEAFASDIFDGEFLSDDPTSDTTNNCLFEAPKKTNKKVKQKQTSNKSDLSRGSSNNKHKRAPATGTSRKKLKDLDCAAEIFSDGSSCPSPTNEGLAFFEEDTVDGFAFASFLTLANVEEWLKQQESLKPKPSTSTKAEECTERSRRHRGPAKNKENKILKNHEELPRSAGDIRRPLSSDSTVVNSVTGNSSLDDNYTAASSQVSHKQEVCYCESKTEKHETCDRTSGTCSTSSMVVKDDSSPKPVVDSNFSDEETITTSKDISSLEITNVCKPAISTTAETESIKTEVVASSDVAPVVDSSESKPVRQHNNSGLNNIFPSPIVSASVAGLIPGSAATIVCTNGFPSVSKPPTSVASPHPPPIPAATPTAPQAFNNNLVPKMPPFPSVDSPQLQQQQRMLNSSNFGQAVEQLQQQLQPPYLVTVSSGLKMLNGRPMQSYSDHLKLAEQQQREHHVRFLQQQHQQSLAAAAAASVSSASARTAQSLQSNGNELAQSVASASVFTSTTPATYDPQRHLPPQLQQPFSYPSNLPGVNLTTAAIPSLFNLTGYQNLPPGMGLPGLSSTALAAAVMSNTPVAAPACATPLPTPQTTTKKRGKWCAMHVRIAWMIHQKQQSQKNQAAQDTKLISLPTANSCDSNSSSNISSASLQLHGGMSATALTNLSRASTSSAAPAGPSPATSLNAIPHFPGLPSSSKTIDGLSSLIPPVSGSSLIPGLNGYGANVMRNRDKPLMSPLSQHQQQQLERDLLNRLNGSATDRLPRHYGDNVNSNRSSRDGAAARMNAAAEMSNGRSRSRSPQQRPPQHHKDNIAAMLSNANTMSAFMNSSTALAGCRPPIVADRLSIEDGLMFRQQQELLQVQERLRASDRAAAAMEVASRTFAAGMGNPLLAAVSSSASRQQLINMDSLRYAQAALAAGANGGMQPFLQPQNHTQTLPTVQATNQERLNVSALAAAAASHKLPPQFLQPNELSQPTANAANERLLPTAAELAAAGLGPQAFSGFNQLGLLAAVAANNQQRRPDAAPAPPPNPLGQMIDWERLLMAANSGVNRLAAGNHLNNGSLRTAAADPLLLAAAAAAGFGGPSASPLAAGSLSVADDQRKVLAAAGLHNFDALRAFGLGAGALGLPNLNANALAPAAAMFPNGFFGAQLPNNPFSATLEQLARQKTVGLGGPNQGDLPAR